MIGHPPCSYISYAAMHVWNDPGRVFKRLEALEFFAKLWEAPIDKICLENPKSCASPIIAKYSQEIQPYYFGDPQIKTTWLWLKGLPLLQHNANPDLFNDQSGVKKPDPLQVHIRKPGKTYKGGEIKRRYFAESGTRNPKERAKFWPGIANAMAEQWG